MNGLKCLIVATGLAGLLATAACTTDDTPEGKRRVETWETRTQFVNGERRTVKTHNVDYVDEPEKGPEWAFSGIWEIQDYDDVRQGDRSCYVELRPGKIDEYRYWLQPIPNRCDGSMTNLAGWRPVGATIGDQLILVDNSGRSIGQFDRIQRTLYRGIVELTNGQVVKAHMRTF